jgi:hypothetical protein
MTYTWDQLVDEAQSRALVLDPSIARDCAAACDTFGNRLADLQRKLRVNDFHLQLGDVDGVACGRELADVILKMVMDEKDGLYGRIGQHIDVVTKIKALFAAQFAAVQQGDSDVAASLPTVQH